MQLENKLLLLRRCECASSLVANVFVPLTALFSITAQLFANKTIHSHSMDNHEGVVAMGLLADSGIIQTIPLCEVEASNTMEGFGIFVTIRVVGRAQLLEITQQEPYLRAVCVELADKLPPNLELPNLVANSIEQTMELLSNMEKRVDEARRNNEIEDEEMKQRIALAKLVSLIDSLIDCLFDR